jgi:hypothetical protein
VFTDGCSVVRGAGVFTDGCSVVRGAGVLGGRFGGSWAEVVVIGLVVITGVVVIGLVVIAGVVLVDDAVVVVSSKMYAKTTVLSDTDPIV